MTDAYGCSILGLHEVFIIAVQKTDILNKVLNIIIHRSKWYNLERKKGMKILKLVFEGLDFFHSSRVEVDFTAEDKVTESHTTHNIFKNIYSQNTISFVGINATGKTTILRLVEMAMQIILDHADLNDLKHTQLIQDKLKITAYIWLNKEIIEWKADIIRERGQENRFKFSNDKKLIYGEEVIKVKKISTLKNKKSIFDFERIEPLKLRSEIVQKEEGRYLKNDSSILVGFMEKVEGIFFSLLGYTNFNVLQPNLLEYCLGAVDVFDANIEEISFEEEGTDKKIIIRFKNIEDEITIDMYSLEKIVSAGTIKGLHIVSKMIWVLVGGGYLIIDEIENHLNKEIIHLIYDIFNSKRTNPHGATLIFSTHYTEVLDFLNRKDNIYVTRKKEDKIEIIRFSHEYNRNDVKKSEIILKNIIKGTAPSFLSIKRLKEAIESKVSSVNKEDFWND